MTDPVAAPKPQPEDPGQAALGQSLKISFRMLRGVLLLIFVFYLFSGIRIIDQHERAFVLTFGRLSPGPDRAKGPGVVFAWPRPFSEVITIPFARTQTVETDTFWVRRATPQEIAVERWAVEGRPFAYALTGDLNVFHSRWAMRYTLQNPERVVFGFTEIEPLLRHELEQAVVKTAARYDVDSVLRTDLEGFRGAVEHEVRRRMLDLDLGIALQRVDLLDQGPAVQVGLAFDAVIEAEQDRSRAISQARGAASRTLSEAQGEAARLRAEAQSDRQRFLTEIQSDAETFTLMLEQAADGNSVLLDALLQDALRRTLANAEETFVLHPGSDGRRELRLLLNRRPRTPTDQTR